MELDLREHLEKVVGWNRGAPSEVVCGDWDDGWVRPLEVGVIPIELPSEGACSFEDRGSRIQDDVGNAAMVS